MADARALRDAAVAGHAGAVVEHVLGGDIELHGRPFSQPLREIRASPAGRKFRTLEATYNLSLSLSPMFASRVRGGRGNAIKKSVLDLIMDVRRTRRRHTRNAGSFARNCAKLLHPMTHTPRAGESSSRTFGNTRTGNGERVPRRAR